MLFFPAVFVIIVVTSANCDIKSKENYGEEGSDALE